MEVECAFVGLRFSVVFSGGDSFSFVFRVAGAAGFFVREVIYVWSFVRIAVGVGIKML